jgi:hypothetical protein
VDFERSLAGHLSKVRKRPGSEWDVAGVGAMQRGESCTSLQSENEVARLMARFIDHLADGKDAESFFASRK